MIRKNRTWIKEWGKSPTVSLSCHDFGWWFIFSLSLSVSSSPFSLFLHFLFLSLSYSQSSSYQWKKNSVTIDVSFGYFFHFLLKRGRGEKEVLYPQLTQELIEGQIHLTLFTVPFLILSSSLSLPLCYSLRMWEMMRLVRIEGDTHVKHEREECVFNHRIDDQFHFTPFLPFSSFQLSFCSSSFCSSSFCSSFSWKMKRRKRDSWKYHVMFFVFKSLIFLHIMMIWKMVGWMIKRDLVQPTEIWTYKKILLELSHSHSLEVRTGNEKQDGRKDGTKRKELEIDTEKERLCTLGMKKKRERRKREKEEERERRRERKKKREKETSIESRSWSYTLTSKLVVISSLSFLEEDHSCWYVDTFNVQSERETFDGNWILRTQRERYGES